MLRKARMVIVTFVIWLFKGRKIHVQSIQDLAISTKLLVTDGKIILGKRTKTYSNVGLYVCGGEIVIGNRVLFNRNCMVTCRGKIIIGDSCVFGPNTIIYDHDHKYDQNGYCSNDYVLSPVVIEKGCWIGANVTILKGTYIGEGSIIGAGTVLRGSIPPHSLVVSLSRELIIKKIEK